jgi:cation diffusion facilitator CzcD-associated flavoprotein CzcO
LNSHVLDYRHAVISSLPALPPAPHQFIASPRHLPALAALEQRARADLAALNFPPPNWVLPAVAPDGSQALDVLVAGAGMCGQTAAYALMREGLANIRVIDRSPRGDEGPWATYARMLTLRSPKHLTGPDLGVPSMGFRAWYEAQHGADGWAALHKVGRVDWRDYLLWVRDTAGVRVDNGVALLEVTEDGPLMQARLATATGEQTVWARKVVLALGRDGSGAPRWPAYPSLRRDDPLAQGRVFHSADAIDFEALRGKRVGVLGAGASAFDNAACALEAGARVTLFARRPLLPQVNKSKWTAFPGFMRGFEALDDARKWRFYTYIFDQQIPPPWETVRRCDAHAAFELALGQNWLDARPHGGGVEVTTAAGREQFDAVVFGTGFDVDLLDRPEIARYTPHVDTWARHVDAPQAAAHPEPARFPYLGPGFQLLSATGAHREALSRLHLFNWGSTMSHGALAGDIPGLQIGATRLAQAIARDLFVEDADAHWARLQAHEEPELLNTRWYVPPERR